MGARVVVDVVGAVFLVRVFDLVVLVGVVGPVVVFALICLADMIFLTSSTSRASVKSFLLG